MARKTLTWGDWPPDKQEDWEREITWWRERGGVRSQIIWWQESLILYKPFNTLWRVLNPPGTENYDPGIDRLTYKKTEKERQFTDGRGGDKEPNHTTARKPGPLLIIQYSLVPTEPTWPGKLWPGGDWPPDKQEDWERKITWWRERGGVRSQIIWWRESLILYKPFNTLWRVLNPTWPGELWP